MAEKPHINVVFVGHVDHGKSTLVGRMMYDTGNVSEQQMAKHKELAEELGKKTWEFAFVMDRLKEERQRGITIDLAHMKFESDKRFFTIIDAPGHRDFVKNMITGASQADAAVLVCSAKDGVQAQTKEHVFLTKTLGVKQLIVAVNKMDAVEFSEDKYKQRVEELKGLLKQVRFDTEKTHFVPTSAFTGDNVAKKGENTPWYKGPTLLEVMNGLEEPEKPVDKPLRLPLQDVFTITGIGAVPVGRVETGVMKVGDKVIAMPSDASGEVKSIEMHHEQLKEAKPGDNVGFSVKGMGKKDIKRGDVLGHSNSIPTVAKEFKAQIVILNHPTVVTVGYTPVFHCHTAQIACKITKIDKKLDPKTGQAAAENPDFIKTGDAAIVTLEPVQPMVIEKASEFPPLGRFAIRDMGQTVAAGMVIDVTPK
jgi:elongation factor 1-alpha